MRNKDTALRLLDESNNTLKMLLRAIEKGAISVDEAQRRLVTVMNKVDKVTNIVSLN